MRKSRHYEEISELAEFLRVSRGIDKKFIFSLLGTFSEDNKRKTNDGINKGLLVFNDLAGKHHCVDVDMGNVTFLQDPGKLRPPSLRDLVSIVEIMNREQKVSMIHFLKAFLSSCENEKNNDVDDDDHLDLLTSGFLKLAGKKPICVEDKNIWLGEQGAKGRYTKPPPATGEHN